MTENRHTIRFLMVTNFFEFYSDKKIMENISLLDVQKDFNEGKSGLFRMRDAQGQAGIGAVSLLRTAWNE